MCLQLAAGGNVTTRIERRKTPTRTYLGTPFVLGATTPALKKPRIENALLDREDTLIVFTDGLSTRTTLGDEAHLAHAPPIVIAQWLLARFGRANDDALVFVAR